MRFWIVVYLVTILIRLALIFTFTSEDSSFSLEFQQKERLDVSKDSIDAKVDEEHLIDPG